VVMFAALFHRRRLPKSLRPPLDREERVVAWAGATGDGVLVVTNYGVWLPGSSPSPVIPSRTAGGGERIGWHEIHKVTWSGRQLTVVAAHEVATGDGYVVVADLPPVACTLLDPDRVPEQVRARVNRSIAVTTHHPLPGGGGVRVVARRVPGVNGLRWTVRYDDGVDPTAPGVAEATAELVEHGRRAL
jgi:hypothetical protein